MHRNQFLITVQGYYILGENVGDSPQWSELNASFGNYFADTVFGEVEVSCCFGVGGHPWDTRVEVVLKGAADGGVTLAKLELVGFDGHRHTNI